MTNIRRSFNLWGTAVCFGIYLSGAGAGYACCEYMSGKIPLEVCVGMLVLGSLPCVLVVLLCVAFPPEWRSRTREEVAEEEAKENNDV